MQGKNTRPVTRHGDLDWTETSPGNRRAVLVERPEIMTVAFRFDAGAVGALHNHPHTQTSYVATGSFDVTIGDETFLLRSGDSFIVPPQVMHGVVALEDGLLIDSFTPRRDDFLDP